MGIVTSAILGAAALGSGIYGATQQAKQAKTQQEQWASFAEPQKEYMRQMYPLQLEMMKGYVPYYQDVLGAQKEILPYSTKALTEQYYPMMGKTYEDILAYGAEGVQPWERQAISVPFQQARTQLGERAAGAGTLRAGPTSRLATLYDIAESEALTKLPYQRRQEAFNRQMQFLGLTPTVPSVSAPGQIGISIPGMPQAQPQQEMDWGNIGKLLGSGNLGNIYSGTIQGGVGGQTIPTEQFGMTWSPYS